MDACVGLFHVSHSSLFGDIMEVTSFYTIGRMNSLKYVALLFAKIGIKKTYDMLFMHYSCMEQHECSLINERNSTCIITCQATLETTIS